MALTLDISGLEAMFLLHYPPLCTTSTRLVKDKDIAQLIVQDVFSNLWKNRAKLGIKASLKEHLYRATLTKSLEYCNEVFTEGDGGRSDDLDEHLNESGYGHEPAVTVANAINSLPENSRRAYILARYEQKTHAEIAELLNVCELDVLSYIGNALLHLRKKVLV